MELKQFLKKFTKVFTLIFASSLWVACDQNRTNDNVQPTPSDQQSDQTTSQNAPSVNDDLTNIEVTGSRQSSPTVTPTPTTTP